MMCNIDIGIRGNRSASAGAFRYSINLNCQIN